MMEQHYNNGNALHRLRIIFIKLYCLLSFQNPTSILPILDDPLINSFGTVTVIKCKGLIHSFPIFLFHLTAVCHIFDDPVHSSVQCMLHLSEAISLIVKVSLCVGMRATEKAVSVKLGVYDGFSQICKIKGNMKNSP